MRVLIAPLNWGLGHATRCIPLIIQHLRAGDEVVLGGDGDALTLLRQHFPKLPYCKLAPLDMRYSRGRSQTWAMFLSQPKLLRFTMLDHKILEQLLCTEHFDLIISDNRFGLYSKKVRCAYITHQLVIPLPASLRFVEPLLQRMHYHFINKFTECLIPDYEGTPNLAGRLSHPDQLPRNARYIGPLSRFEAAENTMPAEHYPVVAVISGPEPQRTMFEEQVIKEWKGKEEAVLLIRGLTGKPPTRIRRGNITLVPYMPDKDMAAVLCSAHTIISRSGYSSIMDYAALGLLDKARQGRLTLKMISTPGQPEQEYLSDKVKGER